MPGYGGFQIAQDIEPFNLASPLEAANTITAGRQANDLNSQLAPLKVQEAQSQLQGLTTQNAASQLALAAQKQKNAAADQAYQNSLIAQAASLVDPNDPDAPSKWDAAMKAAQAKGAEGAAQWIGRYTPAAQQRVTGAYSAQSPLASLAAQTGDGMVGPGGAPSAAPDTQALDVQFHGQSQEQLQAAAQKVGAIKAALQKVANSSNPAATWNEEAVAIGHPELKGQYSPLKAQQLWASTQPYDAYLQNRVTLGGAGVPSPVIPPKMQESGGVLYAVDPITGKAIPVTKATPKFQAVTGSLDDQGRPFVLNETTGQLGTDGQAAGGVTPSLQSFTTKLIGTENATGDPNAKNPRSTATGDGQFINKTWITLMNKYHPELTQGKSQDEILALRSDPTLSAEMVQNNARDNAQQFGPNVPVNQSTLAMAHKLGPVDAQKVINANPSTPLSQILSSDVLAANPQLKRETAGSYAQGIIGKFGTQPVSFDGEQGADALAGSPTGDAFLQSLPPGMAEQVRQIAEGRVAPPSLSSRSPQAQALMRAVSKYDPEGDLATWSARHKMFTDLGSTTPNSLGGQLASINTSIGHLGSLNESISDLNNSSVDILNPVINAYKQHFGSPAEQAAVKQYQTDALAAATEIPKALRGAGVAESDIKAWQKQFGPNDSPVAQHTAIKSAVDLLASRLDTINSRWGQVMKNQPNPLVSVYPRAAATLSALKDQEAPTSAALAAPPPQAQRVVGKVYQSPKGPVTWTAQGWVVANAAK